MNNESTRYLCHHGIKGMKWGERHGPPYPLDKEVSRDIRRNRINKDWKDVKFTSKNSDKIANQPGAEKLSELQLKTKDDGIAEDARLVNDRDIRGKVGRVFNCQNCSAAFEMRRRGYDVCARMRDDGSNAFTPERWFKNGKFTVVDGDDLVKGFLERNPDRSSNPKQMLEDWNSTAIEGFDRLQAELKKQPPGSRGIIVQGFVDNISDPRIRTSAFHAFNYDIQPNGSVRYYDAEGPKDQIVTESYQKEPHKWTMEEFGYSGEKGSISFSNAGFADPREWSYMRTDSLEPNESITEAVISRRLVDK